jgi:hypothetical protein
MTLRTASTEDWKVCWIHSLYNMKILLGDFSDIVGKEDILSRQF